jgi:hypothetical protein
MCAESDHLGDPVLHGGRIAGVSDTLGHSFGKAKPPLDLRQQKHAGIRGQATAGKSHMDRFAANRWKTGQRPVTLRHGGRELR